MLDANKISEMIREVLDSLPAGLKNLPQDIQNNLRSSLQNALQDLDVVTREEFDAQTGVLLRTRQKLETLQKQIEELEQRL